MKDSAGYEYEYLCLACGETDYPDVAIVDSREGVRAFAIKEWIGDEEDELVTVVMKEFDEHDWDEGPMKWEFEMGYMEITQVYDVTRTRTPRS